MSSHVSQLHSRAQSLVSLFEQGGETRFINEAIILDRDALMRCPPGHPHRSVSLTWLAIHLNDRYNWLGAAADLDEAIALDRNALELRPMGHPDRAMSLNNLASYLSNRYRQLGSLEDLDEAIALDRNALQLRTPGHPDRPMSLNNLAVRLSTRYDRLGVVEDLDEAISLARAALELCPPGHADRPASLNSLANRLSSRFEQLGAINDLDEAISLARQTLMLYAFGHPARSMFSNNLASHLFNRFEELGRMEDLDEAVALNRDTLSLRPPGNPWRSRSLNSLALCLATRYEKLGNDKDINEAIVLDREAQQLFQAGHPLRTYSLHCLASRLYTRFTRLNEAQDLEELFELYSELAHVPQIASLQDLTATRAWVQAAEYFHHRTILVAYGTSLRLLVHHLAALPTLPRHLAVVKDLMSSLATDAFSACLRRHALTLAVELLEQGRGVFWSQLARLRSPLDDVVAFGPGGKALADEFMGLTSQIRDVLDSPGIDQHDRVCHLNIELQRVVTDIRSLPGLSRFLLPYLFSDLRLAASDGSVIIVNSSKYSCDALIVSVDEDPIHIPLQITQGDVRDLSSRLHALIARTKQADVTRELAFFLRELWEQVVYPIVRILLKIRPCQSRIWWCLTAEFSLLPLHAAGPYRKGQSNLVDLFISSYTPTLSALIRARQSGSSNSTIDGIRLVAIGQATAVGESELFSVATELTNIGQRIRGHATFTRIEGQESCISRAAEELGRNQWVHFACHGLPNREQPFKSAFALHDGHFTIERIIQCNLENPQFAYLSACHTTVEDEERPDEVIHLASAMQFVGFRSVIGTMWSVDDSQTSKITSIFYANMVDESGRLDHTRAAVALHKTMKSLVNVPFDQRILYIHLGV